MEQNTMVQREHFLVFPSIGTTRYVVPANLVAERLAGPRLEPCKSDWVLNQSIELEQPIAEKPVGPFEVVGTVPDRH
jgi:hypothetical protein